MSKMNRRDFLKASAAMSSLAMLGFLKPRFALAQLGSGSNRNLIVVFQRGGSDGFHVCPPFSGTVADTIEGYRPDIAVARSNIVFSGGFATAQNGFANQVGLHPSLQNLANQAGDNLKIVRGVGTPTYISGSHEAMSNVHHIGHAQSAANAKGWFARLKEVGNMSMWQAWGVGGFGQDVRFATTQGDKPLVVSSLGSYNYHNGDFGSYSSTSAYDDSWHRRQIIESIAGANNPQAAIEQTFQSAVEQMHGSIDTIDVINDYTTVGSYTNSYGFARNCQDTAKILIHKNRTASLNNKATLICLEKSGWDSHGNQVSSLDGRIGDLGDNIAALIQDLKAEGIWQNTTIIFYSEFGRTIRQNGGSPAGTDHAWGNTNLVMGGSVVPGLVGDAPTISNLNNSNRLTPNLDYRAPIEAAIAWLGYDPNLVFPEPHNNTQWTTLNMYS